MSYVSEFRKTLLSKPGRLWAISLSTVGVALLLAIGATIYKISQTSQQALKAAPPVETPVINAVSAIGRIEPLGEVILVSPPALLGGSKVEELLVKQGDQVEAGQTIAVLDNRDRLLAAVEVAQKDLKVAQANLAKVKAGAKSGEIAAQRAAVERLQAQLQGEKEIQAATISRLEAELRDAETQFERYRQLAQNGAISDSDLDQRRLTLETARERRNEAISRQNETVSTLNRQIQEARANLDGIAEVRPVDVQQAQAEVEKAIASVKVTQKDLEQVYVKAPISGQILKINARPGELISEDEGIVELAQTQKMQVIAEVYESDINKVRLGQKAIITSETGSFAGELKGTVNQIGLQIGKKDVLDTDPAADVDVRVVEVDILLTPEDSRRVADLTYSKALVKILL